MKHLLFIITSFRHGGTNKSLENLLSLIDTEQYHVDVFAMEHYGPYKEMLPNCTILPENQWLAALIGNFNTMEGSKRITGMGAKILRVMGSKAGFDFTAALFKRTAKRLGETKEYDAIIAYSEGVPTAFASHIAHPNKIAWVHCDYSSYMQLNNQPDENRIYEGYRSIVCVSEYTKKVFYRIMPEMEAKTYTIHNMINEEKLKKLAEEPIVGDEFITENFTILSVGRIDVVKRFEMIPEIAGKLKERGLEFTWYLLGPEGFGHSQTQFIENIKKYQIDNCFRWLGSKDNPYPYMKNSDLLVMTSKSEACPYVLNEAKVLQLPVITTDYGSASEFVENGKNGVITSLDKMADEIEKIIRDKKLYRKIQQNLARDRYENKSLLERFNALIDER